MTDLEAEFHERCAIWQFDGGMSRVKAEQATLTEMVTAYATEHQVGRTRALAALQAQGVGMVPA